MNDARGTSLVSLSELQHLQCNLTRFCCLAPQARNAQKLVLAVDDSHIMHKAIRLMLETHGYRVVCVNSGVAALKYLVTEELLPDVMLLDLVRAQMTHACAHPQRTCMRTVPHIADGLTHILPAALRS